MSKRKWSDELLKESVKTSRSYRQVIIKLNLIPVGGNYEQVQRYIKELNLDTSHFKGFAWNAGTTYHTSKQVPLKDLLKLNSNVQSYKLKRRLLEARILKPRREICGWVEISSDGRIPLELDHINGNHMDNRLKNLRILCPNCHSLQLTHRGKNKKVY